MEHRSFGPTGRDVAVIGQGTWKLQDPAAAQAALSRGLELGMDHIDTAELYTGSEEAIAPVLEGRRDDVWLVSKVRPENADRRNTQEHCKQSLHRLGTDVLDAYLLHWPGRHPLEETMHSMGDLIDAGLIRHAGVSNFDVEGMEAAQEALGGHRLACNQVLYHPARRDIEVDVLPWCAKNDVAVVAYSPFGSGSFPGGSEGRRSLTSIGEAHGKTPHQVILDCLTRHPSVFTIPKAETVDHVEQNARALDQRLPSDAYDRFDEAFPVPEHVAGVPTL